ncbi:MAG: hypothetical protein D6741_08710 [Planctomycetota bacterium]|nr:MAG: hypothetical protein D6741_08710 [Planctomycetota bacterium]
MKAYISLGGVLITGLMAAAAWGQWGPAVYQAPQAPYYGTPVAYLQETEPQALAPVADPATTLPEETVGTTTDACLPACESACPAVWQAWGEYLYLRPRDTEVPWGVAIDGRITDGSVPIQVSPVATADIQYQSGFRVGFGRAIDNCASIGVSYTYFSSHEDDSIATASPYVIRSLVSHPSSQSAATDYLRGWASNDVDFETIDLDYRCLLRSTCDSSINWLIGARYAELEQDFLASFYNGGREDVSSTVNFSGAGLRIGLEGERHSLSTGLLVYGRSAASFVAGDTRAYYHQGQTYDSTVVDTAWKAGRIVSILDLELGIGWTSKNNCVLLSTGYAVSAWFNAVDNAEFIQGVQTNNFVGLGDAITFDGLVARAEIRF